jgi:uncharacterized protein
MQITVFGATGMVGKHIVQQALWKGYKVIAFGRNADVVFADEDNKNLVAVKGFLTDIKAITKALEGSQGVCSAIGGDANSETTDNTRSLGMKNIIAAMQSVGIKNIAAIGGMGVLDSEDGKLLYETENFPKQFVPVTLEHLKAYEYLQASHLHYSFFCPPNINNVAYDGNYETKLNTIVNNNFKIAAGNLADALLKSALSAENEIGKYAIADKS